MAHGLAVQTEEARAVNADARGAWRAVSAVKAGVEVVLDRMIGPADLIEGPLMVELKSMHGFKVLPVGRIRAHDPRIDRQRWHVVAN